MSGETTPWSQSGSVRPLTPTFGKHRGYFPYEAWGVLAADLTTGAIEWISDLNVYYSTYLGTETICCPEQQSVQLVNPDSGDIAGEITYNSQFTAPPVFTSQENLYLAGCDDAHLYAKRTDNTVGWRLELDYPPSTIGLTSRELLVGYQTQDLDAIDLRTGSVTWGYHLPAAVSAGPASNSGRFTVGLENGVVYLFSQGSKERIDSWVFDEEIIDIVMNDNTAFAASKNTVCRIDTEQTQMDWSTSLDSSIQSFSAGEDRVFAATNDGSVIVYHGETGEEEYRVHGGVLTETPTVAIEDSLYIGVQGHGFAVIEDPVNQSESISIDSWPGDEHQLFGFLTKSGTTQSIGSGESSIDTNSQSAGADASSVSESATSNSDPVNQESDVTYHIEKEQSSILDTTMDDSTTNSTWRATIDPSSHRATVTHGSVSVSSSSGTLEMIDAESGDYVWDVRIADAFSTEPHVHDSQLVLICDGNTLRSFDQRTGDELSRVDIPAGKWEYIEILDSTACIAASDGELIGVDLEKEAVVWERSLDFPIHLPPFDAGARMNVAIGGGLYRLDPHRGETLLECTIGSAATATAIHAGDIYYGTADGEVHIIDLLSLRSDRELTFDGRIHDIVPFSDTLYIATGKHLHAVDSDTYETTGWAESDFSTERSAIGVYNDIAIACDDSGTLIASDTSGEQRRKVNLDIENRIFISGAEHSVVVQMGDTLFGLIDPTTPQSLVDQIRQTELIDDDTSESGSSEHSESDPEETISQLQDIITTKNDQLSELSDALEAKDQQIASLEKTLEEKEDRISTLSQYHDDVLEETVRPLLQCLISIHARQFSGETAATSELATYVEETLERNEVSIHEPTPGDEYSSTYHEKVKTIEGAHPPETVVAVRSPCYEWEFDDSILDPAEVVVSDGSNSLKSAGVVDGEVTDISGAKCVYEGTISDAPRTTARVLSLSIGDDDDESVEEFSTAVRRWEQLGTHPNTVNPIAWDTDPVPWVAHERDGYEHLPDLLSSLDLEDRQSVIADVAESLRNADKYNTRHPSLDIHSIWLDTNNPDVTAAVADWGVQDVVRKTANRSWSRYAAPEQVRGDPIGSHTNIYRLGALSYHLLSGRPPFSEGTDSIEMAIVERTPVSPSEHTDSLSKRVDDLILQAMASDPSDRFDSTYSFRVELLDAL